MSSNAWCDAWQDEHSDKRHLRRFGIQHPTAGTAAQQGPAGQALHAAERGEPPAQERP